MLERAYIELLSDLVVTFRKASYMCFALGYFPEYKLGNQKFIFVENLHKNDKIANGNFINLNFIDGEKEVIF